MDGILCRGHWVAALLLYLTLSTFSAWLAAPQHQVPDAMRGNKAQVCAGRPRERPSGPQNGRAGDISPSQAACPGLNGTRESSGNLHGWIMKDSASAMQPVCV